MHHALPSVQAAERKHVNLPVCLQSSRVVTRVNQGAGSSDAASAMLIEYSCVLLRYTRRPLAKTSALPDIATRSARVLGLLKRQTVPNTEQAEGWLHLQVHNLRRCITQTYQPRLYASPKQMVVLTSVPGCFPDPPKLPTSRMIASLLLRLY